MQMHYLQRSGGLAALGVAMTLSAWGLRGKYSLPFPLALLVTLIAVLLLLTMIKRAAE
jgi:hypothetical protein